MIKEDVHISNEKAAAGAFNKQAAVFDELYQSNLIVQYKRHRVREHVMKYIAPGSRMLELNAGTGDDAIWFASNGFYVHATDISSGMQEQLVKKVSASGMDDLVTNELCSFTELDKLKNKGPYDYIFSNFAGLNCTGELDKVLSAFQDLLRPGGLVTLVILPKFCLWESLLVFRGKFKTAFRRLFSGNGVKAHIEGEYFTCWYYNPSYVNRHLKDSFEFISLEGLCTLVPPSYLENFPVKRPRLFTWLKNKEDKWKAKWPWHSIGDYYIITLKKKPRPG